jgi:hypothetical protein
MVYEIYETTGRKTRITLTKDRLTIKLSNTTQDIHKLIHSIYKKCTEKLTDNSVPISYRGEIEAESFNKGFIKLYSDNKKLKLFIIFDSEKFVHKQEDNIIEIFI